MGGEQSALVGSNQEWYVLRGEMKYGPYEYKSLITMIQTSELFDYNYVWAPHLENWALVGELQEFSKDRLARLIQTKDHLAGAFTERKHPRRDFVTEVYAHNDQSFFDGQTKSISDNGALILLNDPLLQLGQQLMVHFRQSEQNSVPFNALCEIVRKNFSNQRLNVKSGLHYAVRFLQVQDHGQQQLNKWSRESATKEESK